MTAEELKSLFKTAFDIIGVAREQCSNDFPDNIQFVIRRFEVSELAYIDLWKLRKDTNEKTNTLVVDKVV